MKICCFFYLSYITSCGDQHFEHLKIEITLQYKIGAKTCCKDTGYRHVFMCLSMGRTWVSFRFERSSLTSTVLDLWTECNLFHLFWGSGITGLGTCSSLYYFHIHLWFWKAFATKVTSEQRPPIKYGHNF